MEIAIAAKVLAESTPECSIAGGVSFKTGCARFNVSICMRAMSQLPKGL